MSETLERIETPNWMLHIDNADWKTGMNSLASTGIPYVIVNGTVVVKDSKVLKGVYPGKPIRNPIQN